MHSTRSSSRCPTGQWPTRRQSRNRGAARDTLLLTGIGLAAVLFWVCLPLVGPARGDEITEGRDLVAQYCLRCHAAPEAPYSTTAAPTLREMAQAVDWSTLRLQAWLAADHPPMPRFNLTSAEIFALRSYLSSMKTDSLLHPAF
ncbi:cytochrome c [Pelagibius litoralis]|uniref:Cytochrome c n=1 Tax=Pelagibius litoralis TaxID=374515 RepID=A0A967F2F0_9PROT|nr:cytochrome c [Pelagibius litoralis]NIA71783.1 cytochrome c [Pelagibius litoralis]